MADKTFHPAAGHLEIGVVKLYGSMTIGATGAVSAYSGKGISSIARTAAGDYKLTLTDRYTSTLAIHGIHKGEPGATEGAHVVLANDTVDNADPHIDFTTINLTNAAVADPANGAIFLFEITLSNSSVTY